MKRQGDLLIVRVLSVPSDCLPHTSRVLAEGEMTGHYHQLDGGQVYEKNNQLYFSVADSNPVQLNHPEHKPLTFTPGHYKVIRQKEYLPRGWRYVQD